MVKGLIAEKIEMSQVFDNHGRVVPVTKLKVQPNVIVQIKEADKDGYKAAQIGAGVSKKPTKPLLGRAKKINLKETPRILREVSFEGSELKPGQEISVDEVFRKGGLVDIESTSKGKGFAGVVKRWGFAGGPRTHGQSDRERAPGSIGATTTPGRVFKGLKMAGHLGADRVTIRGLEVMMIDKETGEIWLKGSVPGSRGTTVLISKSGKKKKAYHEADIPERPAMAAPKEETETPEEDQEAVIKSALEPASQPTESPKEEKAEGQQ